MKSAFVLFLCLFLAGCGNYVFKGGIVESKSATVTIAPEPEPEPEPAVDDNFISLSGERFEKYYRVIDPVVWDKTLPDISYPRTSAGYNYTNFSPNENTFCYNSLAIDPISYSTLYAGFPYDVHVSGEAVFEMVRTDNEDAPSHTFFVFSFNKTAQLRSNTIDINYDALHEKYSVADSFTSDSPALPKTSMYANSDRVSLHRNITIPTSDIFLLTLSDEPIPTRNNLGFSSKVTTCAIPDSFSFQIFEPFVLQSRNFYQYKTITVKYNPDVSVMALTGNIDVVERCEQNPTENSFTVYFKDYDEPFLGTVLTYWIRTKDGTLTEKKITIENAIE